MKKGYIKLLIFQIIVFLIVLLNSFISSILAKYGIVVLMIMLVIAFKILFGTEKDRHRFTKDVLLEILIILIIFFVIYYISGILIGFIEVENYYTIYGIGIFIIPIIITTILKEYLRYNMLKKSEGSKLLIVTTIIMFTLLDVTNVTTIKNFITAKNIFMYLALTLLPAISNNIAATYISIKAGYKPNIVWLLVMRLYNYLLPIIPATSDYIYSLMTIIMPIVLAYKINNSISKIEVKGKKEEIQNRDIMLVLVVILIITTIVYLTSGYFKYYALSIATGSMSPEIQIGDVVIVEKIENKNELKEGQVIAFNYHGVTVVHRLVEIVEEKGENYYYTKGDDNKGKDNYIVYEDMIIGKIVVKIPYIGLPSVWLNNL